MNPFDPERRRLVAMGSVLMAGIAWAQNDGARSSEASIEPTAGKTQYPPSLEERASAAQIFDFSFPPGDLRRYGGDPTGVADSSGAWRIATAVGRIYIGPECTFKVVSGSEKDGPVEITGEGHNSVVLCDAIILTLTNADWTHFDNFELGPITTPLVFRRNVVTEVSTTATTTIGSKTMIVASADGVSAGMQVFGAGVWNAATVTRVVGNEVTMSEECSQSLIRTPVQFFAISFNTGPAALATLTHSLADGFRVPTVNDTDLWSSLTPAQRTASQKGPVFSLTGDHITVERITGKFISFIFNSCNFSTIKNCDFKGGWAWGCGAFINNGKSRNRRNAALGNRFREHGFEGIIFIGVDGAIISNNVVSGCGDSGIEFYQNGPGVTPVSTYYDGAGGVTSTGNVCIGNFQGAMNYEGNAGSLVGRNTAMCSSSGDYAAWHPSGACAFTGSGWVITGLVCEHNPGPAVYAVISDSIMSGCTFRENQFANVGSFNAITLIGAGNILTNLRAFQQTGRCRVYTMSVNSGAAGRDTTLMNIDLRDEATPADNCLLVIGNTQRLNVRTNGKLDQSLYSVSQFAPEFGASVKIDLAQGISFLVHVNASIPFRIENPLNTSSGTRFTIQVWNQTGGAMPSLSWGDKFRLAPLAPPASGMHASIEFETNAGNTLHYEINRTPVSIPN